MTDITTKLTRTQKDRKEYLEAQIQTNLFGWSEVMRALWEIHSDKLYAPFESLIGYVQFRWPSLYQQLGKSEVYRLVQAEEVRQNLQTQSEMLESQSEISDWKNALPDNPSQYRALHDATKHLPDTEQPSAQIQVWQETLSATNGKPTAVAVEQTAARKFNVDTFLNDQSTPQSEQEDTVQPSVTQDFTPAVTTRATKQAMKALVAYYLDGDRENKRGGNEVWVKPETRHCLEDSRSRVQRKLLESGAIGFDIRVGFYVAGENVEDLINDL